MSRPTNRQIDDMANQLARIDWHRVARRIIEAEHASRDTDADGYPARTIAEGGGNSELTSVEAAANRRGFGRNPRIDEHLIEAIGYLHDARNAAAACIGRLDAIDRVVDRKPDERAGEGTCAACDHHCDGTVANRLRSGLCDACRKAKQRFTSANPHTDPGTFIAWRRAQRVPT